MGIVKLWATFHMDPGHGWLEVSLQDVQDVGLTEHMFSEFSYIQRTVKGTRLFLEEDVDAAIFIRAWEAKHGKWKDHVHTQIVEHKQDAWIRRCDHTTGRDYVCPYERR